MAKKNVTVYEKPVQQKAIPLPKYTKPVNSIVGSVKPGDEVSVTIRTMEGSWTLEEKRGIIAEMASNCLIFYGQAIGIPYYVIHDWKVI